MVQVIYDDGDVEQLTFSKLARYLPKEYAYMGNAMK